MKVNQLKWGTILTYMQMGLGVIVSLIYTPFMIRILGNSEFGLYNTVASFVAMLSVLNLGFSAGYIRYYARYKREKDEESIAKLNGMFLIIFLVIGVIAFLCGFYLTYNLDIVFSDGLTKSEYSLAKILMLLLTINIAISFPMSVFSTIITAHEKFVFLKLLGMIKTVFSPLLNIPLLFLGFRSIGIVSVTLGLSLATDIIYIIFVFVKLKQRFIFHHFPKKLFREMAVYVSFIAINLVVDQVNLNMDKVILGRYCGTTSVAFYSVGYLLYAYYSNCSTAVSSTFTPRIHNMVTTLDGEQRKNALTDLFIKVGRIQFIILGLACTGIVFFGKAFILNFWADSTYTTSYYVALLLIVPCSIPLIQNLGIEIQRALNLHKFRSIVYLIMAGVNLVATIFLCQIWGEIGATIGTAVSFLLANGIIMNIYYHKKCDINILKFWKNILRMTLGLIIPGAIGTVMMLYVDLSSILYFILCIVGYIAVYCASMYFLAMNRYERGLINKMFIKFKSKKPTKNQN